jgi:hypothetical protein
MSEQQQMTWTPEKLSAFKNVYKRAQDNKLDMFAFDGHVFVRAYAKYLIEYLDGEFSGEDPDYD